jgi:TRAP transporter TAXI family solute receptor
MQLNSFFQRHTATFTLVLTAVLVVAMWAIVKVVSPSPPRTIRMSTGAVDGAYHQFGLRYQSILKTNGITLELLTSTGSVENLARLNAGGVAVGFVQGGLGTLAEDPLGEAPETPLRALATIGYEPVWIFSHSLNLSEGLGPLVGKKVGVGVAGSGNQKVAMELLKTYAVVDAQGVPAGRTQVLTDGGLAAAAKLQSHALDALIVVASVQAPAVQKLLNDSSLQLASLTHAEGLARRTPYFQTVSLKRGSVDAAHNLPAKDITLLATTANLVVHADLHPALAYLLLEAAHQTHRVPGLLSRAGEFPSLQGADFPLADESARFFKNGRPFLQTYLPFWMANLVQRLVLVLVPLIAVLFPLFKTIPILRHWRHNNRLHKRYGELKFLEQDIASRQLSPAQTQAAAQRLNAIEHDIAATRFPNDFADKVYTLRQHVEFVRAKLSH